MDRVYIIWANSNGKMEKRLRHCGFKHSSGADALVYVLEMAEEFRSLSKAVEAAEYFEEKGYTVVILEKVYP